MRAALSTAALAVVFMACQAAPAVAQDAPLTVDAILSPVVVETKVSREPVLMTDRELDTQRGGFFSKEWAQQINFGAVLTTYINGQIAMATQLTLGAGGLQKTVTSSAPTPVTTTPVAMSQNSTPSTQQTLVATNENNTAGQSEPPAQSTGSLTDQAAAAGIILNGELASNAWNGVVVPGAGGGTAVLQSADADKIAQVILNTANGVNIQQSTNINLDIPGFAQLQQGFVSEQLRSNLQNSISSALGAALRR